MLGPNRKDIKRPGFRKRGNADLPQEGGFKGGFYWSVKCVTT